MNHLMLKSLFVAALIALATPTMAQTANSRTHAPETMSVAMLAAVNGARAAQGLAPLALDARLNAAACRQARDLASKALHQVEDLSHQGSDGSTLADRLRDAGYGFRGAAENLAAGVADPNETVRLWLASEGHRRNMLTPEFSQAGAAYLGPILSAGGNRTGNMDVWVLVLATPAPGGAATAVPGSAAVSCPG